MQQEQNDQIRMRMQRQQPGLQAQAHQQNKQQPYPTQAGTRVSSPTLTMSSPAQGQSGVGRSSTFIPGYGQQPPIRDSSLVAASVGPGEPMYAPILLLAQVPQHGRGIVTPISDPVAPTANSPARRRPPIEQLPQGVSAPYHHVRAHPGSAVPPVQPVPTQRQQANYADTRLAINHHNATTLHGVDPGPAPAQNPSNLRRSDQPRKPDMFYHQYVDWLLSGPTRLPTTAKLVKFEFEISDSDFKRLSQPTISRDGTSVWSVFEACRRVRFRVCTRLASQSEQGAAFPEDKWVGASTVWPSGLTVKVNEDGYVGIPRKRGTDSGAPCDIAGYLRPGRNTVSVAVVSAAPPGTEFYGAVEMLNTATQSSIIENVIRQRSLQEVKTIEIIKSRLAVGDKELQVVSPEIYISVTDPISVSLVGLPCRGDTCSHLDVFNLRALLESRRPKRCPHGGSRTTCPACRASRRAWPDVPSADTWTCPVCGGDARPGHVVVDRFLQGIVRKLADEERKEGGCAQAVYVNGEGKWRPKILGRSKGKASEVVVLDD